MRFVFYTHSLVSDWNHGNAHFLRGVMRDLVARGHSALALEPEDGWSRQNLIREAGPAAVEAFAHSFPDLESQAYGDGFDHERATADADVVIVHEWTEPALVAQLGRLRRRGGGFRLLFHDTHHRAVSEREAIAGMMLQDYDGILAFGETLRQRYLEYGWGARVFTWHEAADDSLFRPVTAAKAADLVWIGNWGDGERTEELHHFLMEPVKALSLTGNVHGVRYPDTALAALRESGLEYRGWIANAAVPTAFARHRVTLHIPRRPYVEALPGIPTIRVFEALACGIPLICAPWEDAEGLFRAGMDYLQARDSAQMQARLRDVLHDRDCARSLAAAGLETIQARHTCRHRVAELMDILRRLGIAGTELAA
ncbi:glycosyltransferase [Roseomonas frigidaquae]|uniref:Glycosyltransferase n=1 Tax=Falsiroseomonas frigidaquae TaxID=487318 RepID=A0ABX1EZD8_9PROT|nr:glycosyltransferase [Falsiroseomonas frigidaquae]NKE45452.1 glycosyltransferase [Falsiroseomonas frigidaquae]